jgi:hypothetical protein
MPTLPTQQQEAMQPHRRHSRVLETAPALLALLTYMDVRNAGDAWPLIVPNNSGISNIRVGQSFRQPPSMAVGAGHPVLNLSLRGISYWIPASAGKKSAGSSIVAYFPPTAARA